MRRLAAPLPSRWLSILLRRTLVSRSTRRAASTAPISPPSARGCCCGWARRSPRARWCRASTPTTTRPSCIQVAMKAALATGDPAGLCPLAERGAGGDARARLDAGAGDVRRAGGRAGARRGALIDAGAPPRRGERHRPAAGAEGGRRRRAMAAGGDDRVGRGRSADRLALGLATATGVAIPDELFATAGAAGRATGMRSSPVDRAGRARLPVGRCGGGAGRAVERWRWSISTARSTRCRRRGQRGRARPRAICATAYADATAADAAARRCGSCGASRRRRRALCAAGADRARGGAAAVARRCGDDADRLIASMLTAGLDRTALRWARRGAGAAAMPGRCSRWPIPMRGAGRAIASCRPMPAAAMRAEAANVVRRAGRARAGCRRAISSALPSALDVRDRRGRTAGPARSTAAARRGPAGHGRAARAVGHADRALARRAARRCCTAIVAALRAVGLEGEARMIAAEAIARAVTRGGRRRRGADRSLPEMLAAEAGAAANTIAAYRSDLRAGVGGARRAAGRRRMRAALRELARWLARAGARDRRAQVGGAAAVLRVPGRRGACAPTIRAARCRGRARRGRCPRR